MLRINRNFSKSMGGGTEKCLLSRVCPNLTAYDLILKAHEGKM